MTYLITGATGNIGSLVVEELLARGIRPRVLVRDLDKARARFGDRVDVARGDLEDAGSLMPALAGADALFLVNSGPELAAPAAPPPPRAPPPGSGSPPWGGPPRPGPVGWFARPPATAGSPSFT